jgi:hypothetical protein
LARWILLMFLLVCVDVADYIDRSGSPVRYAIMLLPVFGFVLVRMRYGTGAYRRMSAPDRILFVLMVLGLVGSIYGRVVLHTPSGALPVFLPMIIAFLYLGTVSTPTSEEAKRILKVLLWVGIVYAIFNVFANLTYINIHFVSFIAPKTYRNSKVLFVALGVAAGVNAKRPIATLLMVAMGVFIFFTYPSGTNAIVAAVTFLTFFITKPNGSPIRPYVAMAAGVFILAFAVLNFNSTAGVASDYFNAVQKKNNNNARIALYQNGFQTFLQSPIVGSVFTGNITELVIRRDGLGAPFKAPFHDDYIMFSAVGGSVGLLLLFLWLMATEVNILRRYRGFLAAREFQHAAVLRTLMVPFNVLFVAALFNPELSGVARGVTVFGIYALMMMMGEPGPEVEPQQRTGARGSRRARSLQPGVVAGPSLRPVSGLGRPARGGSAARRRLPRG